MCDDNYIIVEKEIPNLENICGNNRSKLALDKKGIKQLYQLITQAGIFDFNGENLRIDENNNLVFIDLEQGIVENPASFFNQDKNIFEWRVFEGIRNFVDTHFTKDSDEYNYLRSLVMKDKKLKKSAYWDRYQKLFSLRKRKLTGPLGKKLSHLSLAASIMQHSVDKQKIAQLGRTR